MIKIYTLSITMNEETRCGDSTKRFEAKTAIGLKEYNKNLALLFNEAIFSSNYLEYNLASFLIKDKNRKMLSLFLKKNIEDNIGLEVFLMDIDLEIFLLNLDRNQINKILLDNYSVKELIANDFLSEVTDMELKVTERKVQKVLF